MEKRCLLASVVFSNADYVGAWGLNGMAAAGTLELDGAGGIIGGGVIDETGALNPPSGTYSLASTGALALAPGGFPLTGAMNATKDFAATSNSDLNSLSLTTRRSPDPIFSSEDVVGTWALFVNGDGPAGTAPNFNDNTGHGTVTFAGDGTFTGTFTPDESNTTSPLEGTFSVQADGVMAFTLTGVRTFVGTVNLSKDTVAMSPGDLAEAASNNDSRLVVMIRSSGTYTNASIAGNWAFVRDQGTGSVSFDGAGNLTGTITTAAGTGTMSGTYAVAADGTFTANIHTVDSGGASDDAYAGAIDATLDTIAMGKPNSGAKGLNDLVILVNSGQEGGGGPVEGAPTIAALAPSAAHIRRGAKLKLTAVNAADSNGKVKFVDFFVDTNGNNAFDIADQRIARDAGPAGGFVMNVKTLKSPSGDTAFFAVATDDAGNQSAAASTSVQIDNIAPLLARATAAPSKAIRGKTINIVAGGVRDIDGTILEVDFWADNDRDGLLNLAIDDLISADQSAVGGWKLVVPSSDRPAGSYQILVQAIDSDGEASPVRLARFFVQNAGRDVTILAAGFAPFALDHVTPNQQLALSVLSLNVGTQASGPFSEEFFISTDNALSGDDISLGTLSVGTLGVTKSRTDLKTVLFADPASVPAAGSYFVIIKVDSPEAIAEADEENNLFISAAADLVIT